MPIPEQEPQPQGATGDLSEPGTAASTGSIERGKGPVEINYRVRLGSEIQAARFNEQFALGLMVVGVQGHEIRDVAQADRVSRGPDGEEVFERIPQIGPKQ